MMTVKMMLAACRASSLYRQAMLLAVLHLILVAVFTVMFSWVGFLAGMFFGTAQNICTGLTKRGQAEIEQASSEWSKAIDAMMSTVQ